MKPKGGLIYLKKNKYVIATIADLHGGAFNAKKWFDELSEGFLKKIKKLDKLDVVFIAGDLFDDKISANSDHAQLLIKFMTKLITICNEKKAVLRIIKGTESHDNRQLHLLEPLIELANHNFKIIHTVESEQLAPDLRVLYIPEEYMNNPTEYYNGYLGEDVEPYDIIIGHGLIDKAAFIASIQESEQTMAKAPILKVKSLLEKSKGPIYYGHIHKPFKYDRFRYVGSYSRWAFGEEEEKGFLITEYYPETGEFTEDFIPNKHATKYDTVSMTYSNDLNDDDEVSQMNFLLTTAETLIVDYLRLDITIPAEHPKPMFITNMIVELFSRNRKVKLKINNDRKTREKKATEEKINKLLEMYAFIFDKKTDEHEKISQFIKVRENIDIPADKVKFYLEENIFNEG